MIDKARKLELLRRSLGIRHKLKVHDSMKAAETHEEMAHSLLARWELEGELQAIEEILNDARRAAIEEKKKSITEHLESDQALVDSAEKRKNKGY